MDLSIIVPVYNVEPYISECINSILNQEPSEIDLSFEVLIINDGSVDNSIEIVENLIKGRTNFYIINKSNGGLSSARNCGIEMAKGEYLWFIDSDDWISKSSLKLISKKLHSQPEAIVMSAQTVESKGNISMTQDVSRFIKESYSGIELLSKEIGRSCVPYTIIRKEILQRHNLRMLVGIYHEDIEFLPRVFFFLKKIVILPEVLYYHRMVSTSITHSLNFKKNFDMIKVAKSLDGFKNNFIYKAWQKKIFSNIISLSLNCSLHDCDKMPRDVREDLQNRLFENRYLFKNMLLSTSIKYKLEWFFFFVFPSRHVLIYKYLSRLQLHK